MNGSMSSDLDVMKNSVVTEMFVDTADQNYLIARWAYHRGMFIDFFWNSVHALEKYLKASLLLNGRSAIRNSDRTSFGHNLSLLFAEVRTYADDLFAEKLSQPHQLGLEHWREETPTEFLDRFNKLGPADNRYNVFGYAQRWEDLHHLDQMVYFTRRVAVNLDAYPFLGSRPSTDTSPKTIRELLERFPKHQPRGASSRLQQLLGTKGDDELRDAGLKLNFQFAPDDYDHERGGFRIGGSSSNSVLYRRIVARVESMEPSPADKEAADLADWVVDNVKLPGEVKRELQSHARTLRNRTP